MARLLFLLSVPFQRAICFFIAYLILKSANRRERVKNASSRHERIGAAMIFFGDKFLMLLHRAGVSNRATFVERFHAGGHASRMTAGTNYDRWSSNPWPPIRHSANPNETIDRLEAVLSAWTLLSVEEVRSLLLDDLSVSEFVRRIGINVDAVRKQLTDATCRQWDEAEGRNPYPRLHFMRAIRAVADQDAIAKSYLRQMTGRYYLYRRHSLKQGLILREVLTVDRSYDVFDEGTYYQWNPTLNAKPHAIPVNIYYAGPHMIAIGARPYKANSELEFTTIQCLRVSHEVLRVGPGNRTQRYHFFAATLSGKFDDLDALMSTRALIMYRSPLAENLKASEAEHVRTCARGDREYDAFSEVVSLKTTANVLDMRLMFLADHLSNDHLKQTLWRLGRR